MILFNRRAKLEMAKVCADRLLGKKPIPPAPQPPTAEEIEGQKKFIEERMKEETRKHELAHALTNRVLTADEISVLEQRLSTAWQIQTNLRMAEGK